MGIQVPLLVIDRRRVSVMSTLFSNRRVRTLNVTMTVIMSLCILMYRRLFGVPDVITDKTYDYFLYVASTLPLWSTRVRRQHAPLSLLCITMILRMRRNFF